MPAAMGVNAKLGIGTTSTVDQPLEFTSESIALAEQFLDSAGYRGSRSHRAERLRRNTRQVGGSIVCTPTPLELDYLLPWITGGTKSVNTIALAETVPARYVTVDRDAKVLTYSGCKVASAQFNASVGGPLTVTTNIVGIDETVANSGTFPSITADVTGGPYMLSDLALTVGGTTYQCSTIDFTIDNALDVQIFNSETPTRITASDRTVSVSISTPYGDGTALHGTALAGVAVVATFTNSTRSFVATFGAVSAPRNSAVTTSRGEIMLNWSGVSRKTGSTDEVVFVNDSTV
jgi:hypothetical protein